MNLPVTGIHFASHNVANAQQYSAIVIHQRNLSPIGCAPGGTDRNIDSYSHHISPLTDAQRALLCDPQTSGGLLVAVAADGLEAFHEATADLKLESFGQLTESTETLITVN